jgi:hypothetical protein
MFSIIDLYGLSIPLRYHQKEKFHTLYSSTLSLLTILGIFYVILKFTIIVLNYKEFSIIQNTEEILEKKLLDFSKIPILIGFINDGGRPIKIDSTYLSIILDKNEHYPEINKEGIMKLKRISTSIKLEYCNLTKHFSKDNNIINLIKDYEYENYLCPVPGQNLSIRGRWGDSINGYDILEFHLIKCENTNEEDRCKNEEEMNKFFKNSYMSIIYLSQSLNHHDVNNPIRYNFRSEVFLISSQVLKRYYYYFIPGEYISDDGLLFVNKTKFDFFDYQTTIIDFVDEEDQNYYSKATLIEVAFSCLDRYFKYERKYLKFQDCFGNIGGWIRIILIVCQFISNYFSEKVFLLDIVNDLFPPNIEYIKKKNFKNSSNVIKNTKNEIFNNNIISTGMKNNYISKIKEKDNSNLFLNTNYPENIQSEKKIRINLNCIEFIFPFFLIEKKNKFKSICFFRNFIYHDISIEVIIPLMERISRLKKIIKGKDYISRLSNSYFTTNVILAKKLKL